MPKEINVNVSSLVDLRAELHRKQQQKKLLDASVNAQNAKKLFVNQDCKKNNVLALKKEERDTNTSVKAERTERIRRLEEELKKEERVRSLCKEKLANKAALYEQLASGSNSVTYEDGKEIEFMVNFDRKVKEKEKEKEKEEDEEDWTEYTDNYGRLRRGDRRQIESLIQQDLTALREEDQEEKEDRGDTRRLLDEEEGEQAPVHYANVASDEPREYGVSHFRFHADEQRRRQQMDALDTLRHKTVQQRSNNQLLKMKKDRKMAERLEKLRKRKRLQPDDQLSLLLAADVHDQPTTTAIDDIPLPGDVSQTADTIVSPPPKKPATVRPWDRGKNTFSQEKWVDKRRDERSDEFAPPSSYFSR